MRHLDLFSGIGGFALATEQVWDDVEHIFCDNEPFAQAVLKKHWPNAPIHGDIKTFDATALGPIDFVTGGFPCQPFSAAGKRKGKEDDRHLWPEMHRVISEAKPTWIIGENVARLTKFREFEDICTDLEALGYEVQPLIIPAASVGAPHRRDRVWIVAHSDGSSDGRIACRDENASQKERLPQRNKVGQPCEPSAVHDASDAYNQRRNGRRGNGSFDSSGMEASEQAGQKPRGATTRRSENAVRVGWERNWLEVATSLCRVDDGVPRKLDRTARLKALGNAIVPQVAVEIMNAIPLHK